MLEVKGKLRLLKTELNQVSAFIDAEVLKINRDDFLQYLERHPKIMKLLAAQNQRKDAA